MVGIIVFSALGTLLGIIFFFFLRKLGLMGKFSRIALIGYFIILIILIVNACYRFDKKKKEEQEAIELSKPPTPPAECHTGNFIRLEPNEVWEKSYPGHTQIVYCSLPSGVVYEKINKQGYWYYTFTNTSSERRIIFFTVEKK